MLSLVYCVAAYRLDRRCNSGQLAFKPQELCTLLRAAQAGIGSTAHPWPFLEKLQRLVASNPRVVSAWTAAECVELERGFALLGVYRLTLMMSQQQAQAQAAQIGAAHQAAAAAAAAAASYGPPIGAGSGHGQLPAGMQLPSTAQLHSAMGVGGMSVSGLGLGMGAFGGLPMHAFLPQQLAGLGV